MSDHLIINSDCRCGKRLHYPLRTLSFWCSKCVNYIPCKSDREIILCYTERTICAIIPETIINGNRNALPPRRRRRRPRAHFSLCIYVVHMWKTYNRTQTHMLIASWFGWHDQLSFFHLDSLRVPADPHTNTHTCMQVIYALWCVCGPKWIINIISRSSSSHRFLIIHKTLTKCDYYFFSFVLFYMCEMCETSTQPERLRLVYAVVVNGQLFGRCGKCGSHCAMWMIAIDEDVLLCRKFSYLRIE